MFTLKLIWNETKWEHKLGIKTLSIENLEDKTLASGNIEDTHHYQGASYYILRLIFAKLPSTRKTGFLDYGCGKGRALFVAAGFGYTSCYGVELAKELCDVANENITLVSKQFPNSSFKIEFQNAMEYQIPSGISTFYFFNPFPLHVMEVVRDRIMTYSKDSKIAVKIIYVNPKFKNVFELEGFEFDFEISSKRYTEAIVYTYNALAN